MAHPDSPSRATRDQQDAPDQDAAVPAGAAAASPRPGRLGRARLAFRRWRRTRPFWGAAFVILGAVEILISVRAPLPVILHVGLQGLAAYVVPAILLLCGLLLMLQPQHKPFYSILSLMLALMTWLTSNLGGFLIGILLAVIGGSLAFAWTPRRATKAPARETDDPTAPTEETEPSPVAQNSAEAASPR